MSRFVPNPASPRHRVIAAALAACLLVAAMITVGRSSESTVEARADAPTTTGPTGTATVGTLTPITTIDEAGTIPAGPVPEPPTTITETTTTASILLPRRTFPPPTTDAPTTTIAATTTEAPPPPPPPPTAAPTTRKSAPVAVAPTQRRSVAAFTGLGAWLDVLDWSPSYDGSANAGVTDIDKMAANGVQTVFIQTSRFNRPEDVLDPDVLLKLINRAHARNMKVVGWYLPTHEDLARDLARLTAAANLPVDAIGVDIESTAQKDIGERNRQLVELSRALRSATGKPIAAIVIPPVVTEILNKNYWPDFPWKTIVDLYDVYLPMGYFTGRTEASGWRDAHKYTAENISLVRTLTGKRVEVHAVGGIADKTTPDDVAGMVRAVNEQGAIGGSLYDYLTTVNQELWPALQPLRR